MEIVIIIILVLFVMLIILTDTRIERDREFYNCFKKRMFKNPNITYSSKCPMLLDNLSMCKKCPYRQKNNKEKTK